ncbi:hypothetical protein COR24_11450 [Vibrio cholerae]|nr:hypothetical protein [Vibrio cholerae]EGR5447163.1 hypothetical protein [Vibrio cholerae]EGR5455967.1 hypothetical protein [Vibrio cholerae]EGR5463310.1 hypothetical protein [Vibrio cholerae]
MACLSNKARQYETAAIFATRYQIIMVLMLTQCNQKRLESSKVEHLFCNEGVIPSTLCTLQHVSRSGNALKSRNSNVKQI